MPRERSEPAPGSEALANDHIMGRNHNSQERGAREQSDRVRGATARGERSVGV